MEEVRASVPMHHSLTTAKHTRRPAHHPAAPRCAPPDEATYPTPPASICPPRRGSWGALRRLGPVGGGAVHVRAMLGAWAIFLSGSSGWCWSAKQWGVEPRAQQDLHLAWWGGREGRGGVGMKGVASCTPTLQGQGRYRWRHEGGGGSWEGKEVRWWATDRLVRGPTVTLAAFRSLRPCTC